MKAILLFILAFFEVSFGHNWMDSPSRVPFAATTFPCMAPRNNFPHVQIAKGQRFQMEWSTGHDRHVYFLLIEKNMSDYLANDSEQIADRYINAAPQQLMSATWTKMHRSPRSWTSQHVLGGPLSNYYAAQINPGHPQYLARPSEFGPSMNLYSYRSTPTDRYVSYRSATYPWILSAWKFEIQEADPNESDVALFEIPGSLTTNGGDFVIHYLWSGYYDCIDVNVLPRTTPVEYVYGKPINGSEALRVNRIDHCVFDRPFQYTSFPRYIVNGARGAAESCIQKCKWWYENGCGGVSVFPLSAITKNWGPHWNPNNNILKNFYEQAWNISGHFWDGLFNVDDGIPYDQVNGQWRGLWRIYAPATFGEQFVGVHQSTINTLRNWIESQNDPWVCIMTNPRFPTTTSDKMTLADDVNDPVWASTCYEVVEQLEFIGFNVTSNEFSPHIPTKYPVGNCISCEDSVAWGDEKYVPRWELAQKCTLCERDNPNPIPPVSRWPLLAQVQVNTNLDFNNANGCGATPPSGANWNEYCRIQFKSYHPLMGIDYPSTMSSMGFVWPPETLHETPDVCAAWAKKQPECSKWIVHAQADWIGCQCVRNVPCCLDNMRSTYANWATGENVASLYETVATDADPTCATGLRNRNNTVCCKGTSASSSCGTYGCVDRFDQPWVSAPTAMCISYNVPLDRSCAKFGPPCRLP